MSQLLVDAALPVVGTTRERSRLLDRLSDWPNPVVVKELRQAVNGRFTGAVLISLLCLQLIVIAIRLIGGGDGDVRGGGRDLFVTMQVTLLFAATVAMPLYVGTRAMIERNGRHLDLLYVTTLPPRAIVAGKLQATALLTALVYVASLPLMSLCYLLRGIDLPTMGVVVAGSYLLVVNAIFLALATACLPAGRVLRLLFALGFLAIATVVMSLAVGATEWAISSGLGTRLMAWPFWRGALVMLGYDFVGLRLLYLLTVGMISPPGGERARPIRRFLVVVWVTTLAGAAYVASTSHSAWMLQAWVVVALWMGAPLLLAAGSGADHPSTQVLRRLPGSPLARALVLPWTAGAAGGFLFALLWLGATLGVAAVGKLGLPFGLSLGLPRLLPLVAVTAYFLAYAGTATLLVRGPWRRWLAPHQTWILTLALAAIGCTLPPVLAFLFDPVSLHKNNSFGSWLLLSPAAAFNDVTAALALLVSCAWCAVVVLAGARWWRRCAAEVVFPEGGEVAVPPA